MLPYLYNLRVRKTRSHAAQREKALASSHPAGAPWLCGPPGLLASGCLLSYPTLLGGSREVEPAISHSRDLTLRKAFILLERTFSFICAHSSFQTLSQILLP